MINNIFPPFSSPDSEIAFSDDHALPLERILNLLSTGTIADETGRLRWSSNFTFLVSVHNGSQQLKAIYKPQQGERPLWDFPDGTLCYREAAAFVVSEALQWRIVPPTILRQGPHALGSIQLYIPHDPETNYFNLKASFRPQLERFVVFDFITNNADRKGGHCLVGHGDKLWGIDHGICFHHSLKLRTVIWNFAGAAIPAELLQDIERFCTLYDNPQSPLWQTLAGLLAPVEMNAMLARTQHLLRSGKFPEPRQGPCYPWPPI